MLVAAGAADAPGRADALQPVPDAQAAALRAAEAALAGLTDVPSGVRLLSAGAQAGTVQYGAAKFVELTRIPAWPGDLEEFAHSQYWAMPTGDLVTVVSDDPVLAGYADEACHALTQLGVATLAVDMPGAPVPRAARRVTIPDLPPALAPLAACIPLQILAYRLSEASGFDPNRRSHLKEDQARFTVSRMLTRRSLLGTGQ